MRMFLRDTLELIHEHYCQVGWDYIAGENGDMAFESECTNLIDVGVNIIHKAYFHPSADTATIIVSVRTAYRTEFLVPITLAQINEVHLGHVVPGNFSLLEADECQFLQLTQTEGWQVPRRRGRTGYSPEKEQQRIDRFSRRLERFVEGAMDTASDYIDLIMREFYHPFFQPTRIPNIENTIPAFGPRGILVH